MNDRQAAKELMAAARELTGVRSRSATWGFEVPAEPVGAKGGRLTDVKADWRKVAKGLKDGNVHVDIASVIKRVAERNSIALSRGETVDAEKTFHIRLSMNLHSNPQELKVVVD